MRGAFDGLPAKQDLSAVTATDPVDALEDLGSARSEQACDAEDLAIVQRERNVLDRRRRETSDLQYDGLAPAITALERGGHLAALTGDQFGDLVDVRFADGERRDLDAVAQNGQAVRDQRDLLHAMRDVYDRHPLRCESPHQCE